MKYLFTDWQAGATPPKGWDVADAVDDGWTAVEIVSFMKASVTSWTPDGGDEPPKPKKSAPEPKPIAQIKQPVQAKPEQKQATITSISQPSRSYHVDDAWRADLVTNEEGSPKPGAAKNWALLLENHPAMNRALTFDAFKMQIVLSAKPAWDRSSGGDWMPRVLRETDFQNAVMWLESLHMTPKASNIASVIQSVAEAHSFDRLCEYLDGVKWDGTPRLNTMAMRYLGVEDGEYGAVIARRFMLSAVARGLRPGCKVDTMPILEGPQGLRKSTFLKALFGEEFFSDELSDIGSKDAKMEMQGVWCIEIAEMHRLNLSATNAVKKWLSQATDRYRPPYGRTVIEAPRRLVLAGTINPDGNPYLKDNTGARRFWPLTATRIDIDAVHRDRDQLWAEAVHCYHAGEPWWVQQSEQEMVEAQQTDRTDIDVWTDAVLTAVLGKKTILLSEVVREIGIPIKEANQGHAARIGRIMSSIGWQTRRGKKGGADHIKFTAPDFDDNTPW